MKEIIFVYNADSGAFNLLWDMTHKLISPQTYRCRLCLLTHGHWGMKPDWKEFVNNLPGEKIFLHKDEFQRRFPAFRDHALPAVYVVSGQDAKECLSAQEISQAADIQALKELLVQRLKAPII